MDREKQNRLSAEWSAYGDALGFMTELADLDRVQYRIGDHNVVEAVAWKRKVGGYSGVTVDFPAGSYSDDTQLRLSTCRSIRSDGVFDVAAFAKVELPAWANYALGAGVSSKEAAANLARTSATWYSNFFRTKRSMYLSGGGNGAAMRVQPHAWAARDLADTDAILLDVIRNTVCTHGHPRGIVGACFHALSLVFAMIGGRPARLRELHKIAQRLISISELVSRDGDLRLFWLGSWEDASGRSFSEAITETVRELSKDLTSLEVFEGGSLEQIYANAAESLELFEPASRGSGTKTAVFASFVASLFDLSDPKSGLLVVINTLGTDTDSIATMAGAIVGACTDRECEGIIQDREYIQSEARRLALVASGRAGTSFRYPDLRSWKPARAAVDAVGLLDGNLWLSGLGALEQLNPGAIKQVGNGDLLGWCRLQFGQTVLARFRSTPNAISPERAGAEEPTAGRGAVSPPKKLRNVLDRREASAEEISIDNGDLKTPSLNDLLQEVVGRGFPPELIGELLLQQVDRGGKDFVERGIALTANILTAYEARSRRKR